MTVRKRPAAKPRSRSIMTKLRDIGMSASEARAKADLFRLCDGALDALGASSKRWSIWVPGRIEVLGKHTDYAGGRSLLCALERGFCARVTPRDDAIIRVGKRTDVRAKPFVVRTCHVSSSGAQTLPLPQSRRKGATSPYYLLIWD